MLEKHAAEQNMMSSPESRSCYIRFWPNPSIHWTTEKAESQKEVSKLANSS